MARNLKTGWVAIATSGPVVHGEEDGRFIKKEWLVDMAEVYNTKVFTAKIWPEHRRWFSAGTVLALKVEPATEPELKGEITLFAILSPSDFLLDANASGDWTFPSIEVGEKYLGTEKFFLKGLGVTDEPASAGVTELKFSKNGKEENALVFSGHQLDLPNQIEKPSSLVKRIFGFAGDDSQPNQDDDDMTKEEFAALLAEQEKTFSTKFDDLEQKLMANFKKPDGEHNNGEEKSVSFAEFSALQEENTALMGRLDALETEFKALKGTPDSNSTSTTEGEGDVEQTQVI